MALIITNGYSMALAATFLTAITFLTSPMIIKASDSSTRKQLQEVPIKCTPCLQNVPPPPPPPPSPSCPPPPAPAKKKSYCPPPPSTYIYMTGPPGELYPVDQHFGAASPKDSTFFIKLLLGLVGFFLIL